MFLTWKKYYSLFKYLRLNIVELALMTVYGEIYVIDECVNDCGGIIDL